MKKRKSQSGSPASSDIPQVFKEKMANLLGEHFPAFISSLSEAPSAGLRVNSLKISPHQFTQITPYQLAPIPWCSTGFYLEDESRDPGHTPPGMHPHHTAGLYYLQEPSAMAAAQILSPQPGEKVLDLAAAPGGKSTHLACLMKNEGVLVANEIHPKRVWNLAENLERCGVTNAIVTNENPERLAEHFGEYFDRVMLDAPCSGEGMFRKSESACREWKPELPYSCAIRQTAILEHAAKLVRPGGFLIYSTCTFSPEENEDVIARFLEQHPEFDVESISPIEGYSPAHPEWSLAPQYKRISNAIRIWPHLARGEGHFIALLVKQNHTKKTQSLTYEKKEDTKKTTKKTSLSISNKIYKEFENSHLTFTLQDSRIQVKGTYVYYLPPIVPDLNGLKVIHPGWWLGAINKDRFLPSHALAMGIHISQAQQHLNLRPDDRDASRYLCGESILHPGSDGWLLVAVDGYPIGWGKRVHDVVKNYYPRGLRQSQIS